jgi:hypothetical protein
MKYDIWTFELWRLFPLLAGSRFVLLEWQNVLGILTRHFVEALRRSSTLLWCNSVSIDASSTLEVLGFPILKWSCCDENLCAAAFLDIQRSSYFAPRSLPRSWCFCSFQRHVVFTPWLYLGWLIPYSSSFFKPRSPTQRQLGIALQFCWPISILNFTSNLFLNLRTHSLLDPDWAHFLTRLELWERLSSCSIYSSPFSSFLYLLTQDSGVQTCLQILWNQMTTFITLKSNLTGQTKRKESSSQLGGSWTWGVWLSCVQHFCFYCKSFRSISSRKYFMSSN